MLFLYWLSRLLKDIALLGIVNRNIAISVTVYLLLSLSLLILGAQVSAPFIYTLF